MDREEYCQRYYESGRNRRTVWTIATSPFPEAHFATFPPALVEPCIKAGTSERGVCPVCGAPWERVVKRTETTSDGRKRPGPPDGPAHLATDHPRLKGALAYKIQTTGWRPTCDCHKAQEQDSQFPTFSNGWLADNEHAIPVPATALDPFGGAGTTGLVADQLGRDCILIDLKDEYGEMAQERILSDLGPMFTEVELVAV